MNYLVVNHVPFAIASAATFRTPAARLAELCAQSVALAGAGLRLLVAAPVVPARHAAAAGCDSEPFSPDQVGFELLHLPVYKSMRAFLRVKSTLVDALRRHISLAQVVQLGYGGHPMMLGEVAWPIARKLGRRMVWNFDAVDPFPAMRAGAKKEPNPVKRLLKDQLVSHKLRFAKRAVGEARVVLAHHPAVAERFGDVWGGHCHLLDAPLFSVTELATSAAGGAGTDKNRPLRLACFAPQPARDPADHLLRALAHGRRLSVPVELRIIASAAEASAMLSMARDLGMSEFVSRVDASPERWAKQMDEVDAVVSTSLAGWHEVETLRAFARGKPVIAYENNATDRLIELGDAGVIVPAENVLLLAQAMIDLHRDRQKLARLGENALRVAQTRTLEQIHRRRADIVAAAVTRSSEHAA